MSRLKVKVEQKHIEKALENARKWEENSTLHFSQKGDWCNMCAIAEAIKDTVPESVKHKVAVGYSGIHVGDAYYKMTAKARKYAELFDDANLAEPETFVFQEVKN